MDGLISDNPSRVTLECTQRRAVAHEIPWVAMIGQPVILHREPVVESVIIGLRLTWKIKPTIKMPLAGVRGIVASISQNGGNGDLILGHVHG